MPIRSKKNPRFFVTVETQANMEVMPHKIYMDATVSSATAANVKSIHWQAFTFTLKPVPRLRCRITDAQRALSDQQRVEAKASQKCIPSSLIVIILHL